MGRGKQLTFRWTIDADRGGLVPFEKIPALPGGDFTATVRGKWGFDDWVGPQYQLVTARPGEWSVAATDRSALVVGRDDTVVLDGATSGLRGEGNCADR